MSLSKVDQGFKRALWLTMLVVLVAKLASWGFDLWMGERQDEMVANQKALAGSLQRMAYEEQVARDAERLESECRSILDRSPCRGPKDLHEAGACLVRLGERGCDRLEDVQLCAAVEALERCSDVFEDQVRNGCARLRRQAQCRSKPLSKDREGLWEIVLDDGFWHGEQT